MSRRPQQQPPVDTNQPEVPEDELLSGGGEGDEVMEEVEEQEGYSASLHLPISVSYLRRVIILPTVCCDSSRRDRHLPRRVVSLTSIVDTYVIPDVD